MRQGWISIHRSLIDNYLWKSEPFTKGQAWVDLLLGASHTDHKLIIKGQLLSIKRGQSARSILTLTNDWKWSKGKVQRYLKLLESDSMIVQQSGHLTTIITICNYNTFQGIYSHDGSPNGSPDGSASGSPDGSQSIMFNNENSNNNKKVVPKSADTIPYQLVVDSYHEHTTLPRILKLTAKRKAHIKARWNESETTRSIEWWDSYFAHVSQVKFLNGENDRNFKANFDFLMHEEKIVKILEGAYE